MAKRLTEEQLFNEVWDGHWNCERFRKSGHAAEVKRNFDNHIKGQLGSLLLTKVTVLELKKWQQSLSHVHFAANRSLEVLSKIFQYASENGLNQQGWNPCRAIKRFPEKSRERVANESEIQKIGEVLFKHLERWPVQITFLFTMLYTGARPRSLQRATWHDLSVLEGGFGILIFEGKSTAKTGDNERVIFPPNIMAMINKLPKRRDNLIFGIKVPKKIWHKVRREAGCPDLWARDLRRTFATVGYSNGVQLDIIGELLNHRSTQTTKIYAKLNNKARIDAVTEISKKITELFDKKKVG